MPSNTAAWLTAKHSPLEVRPAPYTAPRANELVVRNRAVAINPVDWIQPIAGDMILPWIKYPFVIGSDLAGEVVDVGEKIVRFKVGDRILAHAMGMEKSHTSAEGAFQQYTVVLEHMAAPIPPAMSYESAAVLPLAISTAACGMFQKDFLALRPPSIAPEPTGQTLLIWGGSTSVGSNAIQLAVAAGYDVVTTCSPRNFDYVRKLGAAQAFDYNSGTVVADIIAALKGRTIAGALAIGSSSGEACLDIVHACAGAKFVATASVPVGFDTLPARPGFSVELLRLLVQLARFNIAMAIRSRFTGVRTKFIWGGSLVDNEVSRIIYADFLPRALSEGRYVAAPDPAVVGRGLEFIQAGFDAQRKGVSAKKIVVAL